MKLVYAFSQRANPKRPTARHIDHSVGKPLRRGNGREPTCKRRDHFIL